MSDLVRELEIVVKRSDAEYRRAVNESHQAERKAIKETADADKAAKKQRADAAKAMLADVKRQIEESKRLEREAINEGKRLKREAEEADKRGAKNAAASSKLAHQEVAASAKAAAAAQSEASKKAAAAIIDSVKRQVEESKRLERDAFEEGRRLAAQAQADDKRAEQNAIKSSKLAFDEKKKAYESQKKAIDAAAAATERFTRIMLGSQVAGAALNLVKSAFDAISRSIQNSTEHLRDLIAKGEAARRMDREIAALTGNPATILYSAQQAREAAQAGVSPDDYRRGQIAFQAQAGQYIGEGEFAKMGQTQAADLMQRVASYSASQGIDVADPAKLMGTIISKAPKGTSNQELMLTFARAFKGIQLAPGETSPLIGQLSEIVQEEVGPNGSFTNVLDAVPLIRAMAERNPGEASTYGRNLLRGLREARMDPKKSQELGLAPGMSFLQEVGAVEQAASRYTAGGGDEGEFLSKYFKDIREFGSIRTALNAGVRGKGFGRVYAEMAGVTPASVESIRAGYLTSQEGTTQSQQSSIAAAERERANRSVPYQRLRRIAEESVISSGELEKPAGLFEAISGVDRKEQLIKKLVGGQLADTLRNLPGGADWMQSRGVDPLQTGRMGGLGSGATSESMLIDAAAAVESLKATSNSLAAAAKAIQPPVPPAAPAAPARIGAPP